MTGCMVRARPVYAADCVVSSHPNACIGRLLRLQPLQILIARKWLMQTQREHDHFQRYDDTGLITTLVTEVHKKVM